MALERFIPKSPDIFIRNSQDFEVAKFGHLNTIVEYINNNSAQPAGLNGYVQFNDNNALGGDAGLFWDNVNKRLGVGTVTPIVPLNIYNNNPGISSVILVEQDTSAIIGQINQYRKNGSVNLAIGAEIGRLSFGGYFNSTYSPFSQVCSAVLGYYGGTGIDRVGGLRLVTWNGGGQTTRLQVAPDGKVSIGTTGSNAKLQIVGEGSTSATTALLVQNSLGTAALTILDDRTSAFGSNVSVVPTAGGTIQLGVDPNIMFRITDGSGYQKFSIARGTGGGALSLNGGSQGATSYNSSDSGHIFSFPSSNNNADTVTITRPFRGNINLSTINLLNITSTNETALSNATLLRGLYINPTVTDWVSVRAIETTAGNVIFNGGNVGIGTSSPTSTLTVNGSISGTSLSLSGTLQGTGTGDNYLKGSGFTIQSAANNTDNGFYISTASLLERKVLFLARNLGSYGRSDLYLCLNGDAIATNASITDSRVVFKANGNVLIGNTTGTARLTVQGSGSTSATTSFLVQNSAFTSNFSVRDDGRIFLGTSMQVIGNNIDNSGGSVTLAGYGTSFGFNVFINNNNSSNSLTSLNGYVHFGDTAQPPASAQVTITSTTRGFLMPRMTTAEINAIASPANGLEVYNTTLLQPCFYDGVAWRKVTHSTM
jgi:hypothetical protein